MTSTEQAAAAVDAARALLADAPSFSTASSGEVVELLGRVAELARVVESLQVRLAHEVEERSRGSADEPLCLLLGARHAKEAIGRAFGIRPGRALDLLLMARATAPSVALTGASIPPKYPAVAAALAEGELSFAQAHAIVSTLDPAAPRADGEQLRVAERTLVGHATDPATPRPPEQLVVLARRCVALLDPDGVLPNDERQRALRSLRIRQQPDGSWLTTIRSPADDGAAIKALADAYTGPRVNVAFHDDRCARGGCDGKACHGDGDGDGDGDGGEVSLDDRTREQKAHDAFIAVVKAHAASGTAPVAGGEPPTLVLTGTIDAYAAYVQGLRHAERTLTIEHTNCLLPIERIDQVLCHADVQQLVVDGDGHPLALGRTQRLFTRAQKRALARRDKGCRVPGCGMPVAWCETHHIVPWQLGGPTDVDNGILVCNYHHHEIHAGRLRVEEAGPGPGQWRIVPELQPARSTVAAVPLDAEAGDSAWLGGAAPGSLDAAASDHPLATAAPAAVAAPAPAALATAAPAALAVRLPDLRERKPGLDHTVSTASSEPDPLDAARPSTRPPRRRRRPGTPSERHLRALLERQARARERGGRADALTQPRIVLRR
ncbi:HNH endonuclease signature motif containing protein [Agrococcus carbonis]|uniref:HNH endonuclease n=1 Tax=Agrococcus carbonis TaxID=684552 RepID=A0A1H1NKQ2_9MICO|nr:HNH endonuclease signature motif containing protein [Agrococcus carbonis]SDR99497.1 HNH endonuclease [Agrococcus carbonis]